MHCTCNPKEIQLPGSLSPKKRWRRQFIVWKVRQVEVHLLWLWVTTWFCLSTIILCNPFVNSSALLGQITSSVPRFIDHSSPSCHLISAQVPRNIVPWCQWNSHPYILCIIAENLVFPIILPQPFWNTFIESLQSHHECKVPVLLAEWNHTLLPAERT